MSQDHDLDPAKIMEEYVRNRGDIFEEWHFMARYVPLTIVRLHDTAGYILQNDNKTTPDQELSVVFRELIALCQLSAKGDKRFAANHVRRLYRFGVTNAVMFEAAEAFAPVVGHSSIALVAQAILLANDPAYPFGKMPKGGEPGTLTPFPEMKLGWEANGEAARSLLDLPEWQYVAQIDPELARRTAAFVDHCLTERRPERVLSPGARELIAIAALCARGEVDIAASSIRRAYAYGFSRRQVLEAISCVQNMTGAVSVQLGVRAMQQADRMMQNDA
jgi:alkylhydroperoxidase/carboxymuconolactone decarboxylase family protein YurZ